MKKIFLLGTLAFLTYKIVSKFSMPWSKNIDTDSVMRLQSENYAAVLKDIFFKNGVLVNSVTASQFETLKNIFRNIALLDVMQSSFKQLTNFDLEDVLASCLTTSQINTLESLLEKAMTGKAVITTEKTSLYSSVIVHNNGIKQSRSGLAVADIDKETFVGRCVANKDGVITINLNNVDRYVFASSCILV